MEKLPGELSSNILIRLPARVLAQMRCVSKPLNTFLTRPSFIKSHLNRSICNEDEIILVFNPTQPFTAHGSQSPQHELTNFIKFPFDSSYRSYGKVIGSVNGLVCLSFGYDIPVIHIWNPSLSAVITLPPYTIPSVDGEVRFDFRFGFDPKTEDYKVVKLTHHRVTFGEWIWLQVEIYSMRNGSWKLITERIPSSVIWICEGNEVCLDGHDGHVHWLCLIDRYSNIEKIVAFDLGIQAFSEISLPDYTSIDRGKLPRRNVIGVLDGKLCVMSNFSSDSNWEVWVMNEYGNAASWILYHEFTPLFPFSPLGFTLNNQFLFETYDKHLALSKHCKAESKIFKSMAPFGCRDRVKVVVYVESLVWVAPTKNVSASVAK